MKAIVIDDSRIMRRILGKTLISLGFEVLEAEHGQAGLDRLDEHGPVDLALVDWNMPVMDGLTFVNRLRAQPEYDATRLVMVTTEVSPERVSAAIQAGANSYLTKPFNETQLREKLSHLGLMEAV